MALAAAGRLAADGISAEVIDLRCLAPVRRIEACVPLPFADALEQAVIPTVGTVTGAVRALAGY
jgi:pyruvate/2-oxoglutarate/acetoin dehydrogenase E1 component